VLLTGAFAPLFLRTFLWHDPWFRLGAALGGIAMVGYLLLVTVVVIRTDRSRVEFSRIVLGAFAGVLAVVVAIPLAFGEGFRDAIVLHWTFILGGFFPLTIVGYAFQFFPVTSGRFPGATTRGVAVTIGSLAGGVFVQGIGILSQLAYLRSVGAALSVLGALGYTGLMVGRFVG